jgi:amino acid adenylation domain-containing protein
MVLRSDAEQFWRDLLSDLSLPLQLPNLSDLREISPESRQRSQFLSLGLASDPNLLAQTLHCSLAAIWQGLWGYLLSRYTGEIDFLIGVAQSEESQDKSKHFFNPLPFRLTISQHTTASQWFEKIQQQWSLWQTYQKIPLAQVKTWSDFDQGLPLFETLVMFKKGMSRSLMTENGEQKLAQYALILEVDVEDNSPLTIHYDPCRFSAEVIARLGGHLETLIQDITTHPDKDLRQLTILTASETNQLLFQWNQTQADYPLDRCIHQLFEEQVEKTPDAIAVVFDNQQLTYQELNYRANQLASYLQKLGVKSEVLVGICVERSWEMLVGLLGIWKAGGAYVPLDPSYPPERLAYMLDDAQVSLLITQEKLVNFLSQGKIDTICLARDWQKISQESTQNLMSKSTPNNLAYVMYTSGSTGRPKGAMIVHRGLVNYLWWCAHYYSIEMGDGAPVHSSLSFDATITALYSPLLRGKTVELFPTEKELDRLAASLTERPYSLIKITPAHLAALQNLRDNTLDANCRAKALVIGGEPLPRSRLVYWRKRNPNLRIINEYGPTETVVGCCIYEVPNPLPASEILPIGRPIANTQLYILDCHLRPVPIGITGELYIGGAGVARGYWNRPDLTAERFIRSPFLGDENSGDSRLYKTGDRCRYLPDGNIEFLGRIDNQVKIRGFRIELGEIEAAISQYPQVRETVVVVRESGEGDRSLVAYVTLNHADKPIDQVVSALRTFLRPKLLAPMVPTEFVILEAFPLTPNGKIDRKALPAPPEKTTDDQARLVLATPPTTIEQSLVSIWQKVLGRTRIDIQDNFFELGGHSLLATQVIARIRQDLKIEASFQAFFDHPTIAQLAAYLTTLAMAPDSTPSLSLDRRSSLLPLSFVQQRFWFLHRLDPLGTSYHLFYGWQLEGELEISALEQSLNILIERHEIWRTTFAQKAGQPCQQIERFRRFQLPIDDLESLSLPEQKTAIDHHIETEIRQPFALERGDLLRFRLLRLSDRRHLLLFTCHHIVFDDWSYGVFWQELSTLYNALRREQPANLTPLPIQYADFTLWQRQVLSGERLEHQLNYWLGQLAGTLPILQLPSDRPRPPVQCYQGARRSLYLSRDLTEQLKQFSQKQEVTLFMTLLAAFKLLLHRYSGQEDVIVGTPIAGRTHPETEGLIGCFLNTLALRTNLTGNPNFEQLLSQVREVTLAAYAHQDLPFEKLVEALKPERDLSRHPIFDVLMNSLNTPPPVSSFEGLQAQLLAHPADLDSKFALTLYLQEEGDRLKLDIAYQTALFSPERIEEMLHQLRELLCQIVENPHLPLYSYSLVSREFQPLLPDPRLALPEPSTLPVPHQFAEQVARSPGAIALCRGDIHWSYETLWERSQAIAQSLLTQGLKPRDVVALSAESSPGSIASMMGILLAGGVLLTLAPNLPFQRRQMMAQAAKARFLIEVGNTLELDDHHLIRVAIDPQTGYLPPSDDRPRLPVVDPDDPAYIFFTSGTTGVPKGVLGVHKGLSHFLNWQRETFKIGPGDRFSQLTGLSFDVVLREILLPLTSGATLCLPDVELDILSPRLLPWLARQQITVLHTVPSLAQAWLGTLATPVALNSLRWLFFAGEPLSDKLVQRWRETFPESGAMINLYGPTETTLAKCYYPIPEAAPPGIQPIGYPLPQTQALVLKEDLQPCGMGESGEIFLRTPFRSLGYINAPSRFIANPYRPGDGDLLYPTGDSGRYRPDGSLEILGRLDRQVKIRGVRIELGELENYLLQHPAIQAAVVIAEGNPENLQLIAYWVSRQESPTRSEIRRFLLRFVPEVMVPTVLIQLDRLPLTPNGKIDRRALPAPDLSISLDESSYLAPRTPLEQILLGIWREILPSDRLGIRDSFFEMGGHSLLAVQLFSRIQQRLGYDLPLITLYQAPTIEQLADLLEHQGWQPRWLSLVPIQPQGSLAPFFFHGGSADALTWEPFARRLGNDRPFYALQRHDLNGQPIHTMSLEAMATLCLQEMRTVQPQGPYWLGGHCFGGTIAFEIARQLQAQGETVALLALVDAYAPLASAFARAQSASLRSRWHRFNFWLAKSYYYHAPKLLQGDLAEKFGYLLDKGQKKIQYRRKRPSAPPPTPSDTPPTATPPTLPYEARYRLAGQANRAARNAYQPQPYAGKITLLRARQQPWEWAFDRYLGWAGLTTVEIDLHVMPGFFGNLFNGRSLPLLVDRLQACQERVMDEVQELD